MTYKRDFTILFFPRSTKASSAHLPHFTTKVNTLGKIYLFGRIFRHRYWFKLEERKTSTKLQVKETKV